MSPMALAAVRSKAVVLLLFFHCLLLLPFVVGVLGFVLQYVVTVLVLQASRLGRESWFLYFYCVLIAMSLLSFFDSS